MESNFHVKLNFIQEFELVNAYWKNIYIHIIWKSISERGKMKKKTCLLIWQQKLDGCQLSDKKIAFHQQKIAYFGSKT